VKYHLTDAGKDEVVVPEKVRESRGYKSRPTVDRTHLPPCPDFAAERPPMPAFIRAMLDRRLKGVAVKAKRKP
jgi:hypothetical protein